MHDGGCNGILCGLCRDLLRLVKCHRLGDTLAEQTTERQLLGAGLLGHFLQVPIDLIVTVWSGVDAHFLVQVGVPLHLIDGLAAVEPAHVVLILEAHLLKTQLLLLSRLHIACCRRGTTVSTPDLLIIS